MNDTATPLLVLTDSDRRDPLLKNALTANDLFGDMLKRPVDEHGKLIPMPDVSLHPTRGVCRVCRRQMPRNYIAFCGGWTALRECDNCAQTARIAAQQTARKAEARERTEPAHSWEQEEAA